MRLTTLFAGIALLALLGLCTVNESVRQTRIEYEISQTVQKEKAVGEEILRLQARLATLKSPMRLEAFVRDSGWELVPLKPAESMKRFERELARENISLAQGRQTP